MINKFDLNFTKQEIDAAIITIWKNILGKDHYEEDAEDVFLDKDNWLGTK